MSYSKMMFVPITLLLFLSSTFIIIPQSFAQSTFDSEKMGLGMPKITMDPIYGSPGTTVEILVENMPSVPNDLDPRIEFFIYLPFLSSSGNVPQTCNGEKCLPLYSFEEIKQGKLSSKNITFTLFSKENPKSTVESGIVKSICDLKINGVTVERVGHTCFQQDQPTGEYEVKFGWGVQRTNVFDIRESIIFTVINATPNEKIEPKSLDVELIKEFQNGFITIAQFDKGLKQLNYDFQNIRKTKALLNLLPHQFDSLNIKERNIITRACDDLLAGNPIYTNSIKANYERGDTMFINGCVKRILPTQELIVKITYFDKSIVETKILPEVDGSFYIPISVGEKFIEDGSYTTEVIYGEHRKSSTIIVPEFGSIVILILTVSIIGIIISFRLNTRFLIKM